VQAGQAATRERHAIDASRHPRSRRPRKPRFDEQQGIESAVAEERRRFARELHDGVAQDLAYIVSQSLRLARATEHRAASDLAQLELIAAAADRALSETRAMIYRLAPPTRPKLGAAIRAEASRISERAGLRLELQVGDGIQATAEIEQAVLRIVQEAVSNAARHANASTISISLSSAPGGVLVTIADNGHGFDLGQVETSRRAGFGLVCMRERARSVGGDVRLHSRPGRGTVVEVALPA
jgi:signal transduction histidine kinase